MQDGKVGEVAQQLQFIYLAMKYGVGHEQRNLFRLDQKPQKAKKHLQMRIQICLRRSPKKIAMWSSEKRKILAIKLSLWSVQLLVLLWSVQLLVLLLVQLLVLLLFSKICHQHLHLFNQLLVKALARSPGTTSVCFSVLTVNDEHRRRGFKIKRRT